MRALASRTALRAAVVGGVGAVVVLGASAVASIPSANGTIYGCYAKSSGATRIIDPGRQKCTTSEQPISWSQRGPRGPIGPQGLRGVRGPAGTNGTNGTDGTDGVSGYEEVDEIYADQPLPIDKGFTASCPTGKKVLGGGTSVQLYDDNSFIELGGPAKFSMPSGETLWDSYVQQAAVDGATKAKVTVSIICANVTP